MSGQVRTGHARSGQVGFPRASHPRWVCFLGPATRPIRTSLRSLTRRPSRTRRLLWSVQAARTVVMVSCTAHARWSRFRGCPTHAHAEFVRGRLRAECAGLGASNSGVGPRTLQFRVWGALLLSSAPPCPLLFPLLRSSSLLFSAPLPLLSSASPFSSLFPPALAAFPAPVLFFRAPLVSSASPPFWAPLPCSSALLCSSSAPPLLFPDSLLSSASRFRSSPSLLFSPLICISPAAFLSSPLLLSPPSLLFAAPLLSRVPRRKRGLPPMAEEQVFSPFRAYLGRYLLYFS